MKGFRTGDHVDFTTENGTEFTGTVADYNDDLVACRPTYTMRVEGKGAGAAYLKATADKMAPSRGLRDSGGAQ